MCWCMCESMTCYKQQRSPCNSFFTRTHRFVCLCFPSQRPPPPRVFAIMTHTNNDWVLQIWKRNMAVVTWDPGHNLESLSTTSKWPWDACWLVCTCLFWVVLQHWWCAASAHQQDQQSFQGCVKAGNPTSWWCFYHCIERKTIRVHLVTATNSRTEGLYPANKYTRTTQDTLGLLYPTYSTFTFSSNLLIMEQPRAHKKGSNKSWSYIFGARIFATSGFTHFQHGSLFKDAVKIRIGLWAVEGENFQGYAR